MVTDYSSENMEINSIDKAIQIAQSNKSTASDKTRALFYLRCLNTEEAALALEKCMTYSSVLIDHEIAYILGQMKQQASIPFLFKIINDKSNNDIVRHEAIEALGNFEDLSLIKRISPYLNDKNPIIHESARLAIKKLEETMKILEDSDNKIFFSKYHSRDPAFPFKGTFEEAVDLFKNGTLEEKYKSIFYFRDLNTKEAVEALIEGFKDTSELLRHEIAYVFGQMQNPLSQDALIEVLNNTNEADIVRHEAAEALGNIGTDKALDCLSKYKDSEIKILQESANVGLGISDNDDYVDIGKIPINE